jgi:hypothetical protein
VPQYCDVVSFDFDRQEMPKLVLGYLSKCFRLALAGSLGGALNWAGIIGIGIVGAIFDARGLTFTEPHRWQEIVLWTLIYTAVAWVVIFFIRLIFVAPFQIYIDLNKELNPLKLREIEALEKHATELRKNTESNDPVRRMLHARTESMFQSFNRPRLRCSFDMNDPGCRRPNTAINVSDIAYNHLSIQTRCDWYRVKVETRGTENICGCRGRLISIKRGEAVLLSGENPVLPFAPYERSDAVAKTIHPNVPEYLDLLAITEFNQVIIILHEFQGSTSVNWPDIFSLQGDYLIEIAVVSDNAPSASLRLLFKWRLNRTASEIVYPS